MRRDPLIIGAGPAGTAAAITLARAGHQPILIEKTTGPTDKVCGDFLSLDTLQRVQSLGVDPNSLGAVPIHRVRLIHGERAVDVALPFPALGLSRRTLDAALLRQAERAGAILHTGLTVRRLTNDASQWTIQTDTTIGTRRETRGAVEASPSQAVMAGDGLPSTDFACAAPLAMNGRPARTMTSHSGCVLGSDAVFPQQALTSETVFLATGKHDVRDAARPHGQRDAIGMKMYFALAPDAAKALEGTIELTLFPGGYAGMQRVEAGQTVLCIAVERGAFQTYGGGWSALIAAIERTTPRFTKMLAGARALLPRPLAVAGIPYGYQAPAGGLFRLGDQAAVIPSLTGDGIAIALHSGQQAAEAWLGALDAATYQRALARSLAPQMRLASLLHRAGMSGLTQAAAIPLVRLFPSLLRHAASRTRVRTAPQPKPTPPSGTPTSHSGSQRSATS